MKAQICCKDETICAGLSVQDDIQRFYLLVCFRCKRGVEDVAPYKSCFESIAKSNLHFL